MHVCTLKVDFFLLFLGFKSRKIGQKYTVAIKLIFNNVIRDRGRDLYVGMRVVELL